jgi:hypothetical protein
MLPTTETARMSCGLLLLAAEITAAVPPYDGVGSGCFLFSCLYIMIRTPYINLYVSSVQIQSSTIYASKPKRPASEGMKAGYPSELSAYFDQFAKFNQKRRDGHCVQLTNRDRPVSEQFQRKTLWVCRMLKC